MNDCLFIKMYVFKSFNKWFQSIISKKFDFKVMFMEDGKGGGVHYKSSFSVISFVFWFIIFRYFLFAVNLERCLLSGLCLSHFPVNAKIKLQRQNVKIWIDNLEIKLIFSIMDLHSKACMVSRKNLSTESVGFLFSAYCIWIVISCNNFLW